MPQLRLHISAGVAVGALMLLTASPASADTPPPPGPASLPALTVPGKPTLESTDSRGTNVEIMSDDPAPSLVPVGGEGVSRIELGRARQTGGRERRPYSPLLREQGNQE